MTYSDSGFVELSTCDIAMAMEALREEEMLAGSQGHGRMTDEEIAANDAFSLWIASWIRRFASMKPGRVHFSTGDMQRLRGILFTSYKLRFIRNYRAAVMSDNPAFMTMARRLQHMEELEARMWKPEPLAGSVICFERTVATRAARRA